MQTSDTILNFLELINEMMIFGRRFLFNEHLASSDDQDILVYTPMLSALSLEYKDYKNKIRLEVPISSINSHQMPLDHFTELLSPTLLTLPLSSLDLTASYFALNWLFLMNLKSKIQPVKGPNLLAYYRWLPTENGLTLRLIGV